VLPPDVVGLVDEQVREAVVEAPPVDGLELDGVGAGGDLEGELLTFGAVEEVYVLLVLLRLLLRGGGGGGDDLHRWVSEAAGTGEPKRTARGGVDSALTEQLMPAFIETRCRCEYFSLIFGFWEPKP